METNFPEGEAANLKLAVKAPKEFTLALRRPSWAGTGFVVKVNGTPVSVVSKPGSYIEIKRRWKTGDSVSLTLPKTLRLESSPDNPRVAAVMWGPLVLAGDLGPEPELGAGRGGATADRGVAGPRGLVLRRDRPIPGNGQGPRRTAAASERRDPRPARPARIRGRQYRGGRGAPERLP